MPSFSIGRSPYEAVFGIPPRTVTNSFFPEAITHAIIDAIESNEEEIDTVEEMNQYVTLNMYYSD